MICRFTAARWIDEADSLIIAAGAGMGVDLLPDFAARKVSGMPIRLWGGPKFASSKSLRRGRFVMIRNWPGGSTAIAWRCIARLFRMQDSACSKRSVRGCLKEWLSLPAMSTATSSGRALTKTRSWNATGRHHLQCLDACSETLWPADGFDPVIDAEHSRVVGDMPHCPACGALARPRS